jgi:hypothetical protein
MSGEVGRRPRCLLMAELCCRVSILAGRSLLTLELMSVVRWLRRSCCLPLQCLDFLPEFLPLPALRFQQLGQISGAAHGSEISILEPVLHPLHDRRSGLARGFIHQLPIRLQIGSQPVESLLTQAGAFFAIELVRILALATAGERGGAGGVVAVRCRDWAKSWE